MRRSLTTVIVCLISCSLLRAQDTEEILKVKVAQAVRMLALRHTLAVRVGVGEVVALDQGDALEVIDQRPRCPEPGHAAAEDDRVHQFACWHPLGLAPGISA